MARFIDHQTMSLFLKVLKKAELSDNPSWGYKLSSALVQNDFILPNVKSIKDPKLREVHNKMLYMVSLWHDAFSASKSLIQPIYQTHMQLKSAGAVFPEIPMSEVQSVRRATENKAITAVRENVDRLHVHEVMVVRGLARRCSLSSGTSSSDEIENRKHANLLDALDKYQLRLAALIEFVFISNDSSTIESLIKSGESIEKLIDLNDEILQQIQLAKAPKLNLNNSTSPNTSYPSKLADALNPKNKILMLNTKNEDETNQISNDVAILPPPPKSNATSEFNPSPQRIVLLQDALQPNDDLHSVHNVNNDTSNNVQFLSPVRSDLSSYIQKPLVQNSPSIASDNILFFPNPSCASPVASPARPATSDSPPTQAKQTGKLSSFLTSPSNPIHPEDQTLFFAEQHVPKLAPPPRAALNPVEQKMNGDSSLFSQAKSSFMGVGDVRTLGLTTKAPSHNTSASSIPSETIQKKSTSANFLDMGPSDNAPPTSTGQVEIPGTKAINIASNDLFLNNQNSIDIFAITPLQQQPSIPNRQDVTEEPSCSFFTDIPSPSINFPIVNPTLSNNVDDPFASLFTGQQTTTNIFKPKSNNAINSENQLPIVDKDPFADLDWKTTTIKDTPSIDADDQMKDLAREFGLL